MNINTILFLALASMTMESLAEDSQQTDIDVEQNEVLDVSQTDVDIVGSLESAKQNIENAYGNVAYEGDGRILYPLDSPSDSVDPEATIIKLKNVQFSISPEYTPNFANGDRRVYVHYPQAPTQKVYKKLHSAGIELTHYVTENTWIVKLNVNSLAKLIEIDKQVYFAEIAAADLSSPSLVRGQIPFYAFDNGQVQLQATLYEDADFIQAREQLVLAGAENIEYGYSSISFSIDPERLTTLFELDFIRHLDFIDPPAETNNENAANLSGIRSLGSSLPNLTGADGNPLYGNGINIGQWEPSTPIDSHPDFGSSGDSKIKYGPVFTTERQNNVITSINISAFINPDPDECGSSCDHATHVAGTLVGGRLNQDGSLVSDTNIETAGMAPGADLISSGLTPRGDDVLFEMEFAALVPEGRAGYLIDDQRFMGSSEDISSAIQTPQIHIATHSWGFPRGWERCNEDRVEDGTCAEDQRWFDQEDSERFGEYTSGVESWDNLVNTNKNLIITQAAGNDRNDGPDASSSNGTRRDGPFDSISFAGVAKNVITVGAVDGNGVSAGFSGWGPTDDGRIKPDVVALGVNLKSAVLRGGATDGVDPRIDPPNGDIENDGYDLKSGTSMATPVVAGGIALLKESWSRAFPNSNPAASMIKALVINTARGLNEDGSEQNPSEYLGPNYKTGWGLFDAEAANNTILQGEARFNSLTIPQGALLEAPLQTFSLQIPDGFEGPIKITAAWTERGTNPNATKALIHDVDLILVDPQGNRHQPWVLGRDGSRINANDFGDMADEPATQGDNDTDNVEQIFVATPQAGIWTLQVIAGGNITSDQEISIVSNVDLTLSPESISLPPQVKTPIDISTSASLTLLVDTLPTDWTPRFTAFGFDAVDGLPLDGLQVEDINGNIFDLMGSWTQFNVDFDPEGTRLIVPQGRTNRRIRAEWWYTN